MGSPRHEWHKTFVLIPRTTIGGEKVYGKCYTRTVRNMYCEKDDFVPGNLRVTQYATEKEVFAHKLKGKVYG